jgi:hypothetical protein
VSSAEPEPARGLDLLRARVALRDRSIPDVLDLAMRFIVVRGRSYAKVALVSLAPLVLVSVAAGFVLGWRLAWFVSLPLAILTEIPFTVLASRLVFQEEVRARDVLAAAFRAAPGIAFARLLSIGLTVVGLALLVIPGVWLATTFFFLSEVMLLERASIGRAIGRSQKVAGSVLSEVLIGMITLALVPLGGVVLFDTAGRFILGELLQFATPAPVWSSGGSVLATLGLFAQVPYLATARFFLYLNVRTRSEGWDIQTRFHAIAARRLEGEARAGTRRAA